MPRYRRPLALAVALVALVAATRPVHAEIIVNTFGPGDSFGSNNVTFGNNFSFIGFMVSSNQMAVGFTPSQSFTLDRITYAVSTAQGTPGPFSLSVVADSNGTPTGMTLESFIATATATPSTGSVLSLIHPLLLAGQQYWLVASSTFPALSPVNDVFAWYYGDRLAGLTLGVQAEALSGGVISTGWLVSDPQMDPAVRIEGSPLVNVPQPSGFVLLGIGVSLFWVGGWRPRLSTWSVPATLRAAASARPGPSGSVAADAEPKAASG
jgi:hypothetical protein